MDPYNRIYQATEMTKLHELRYNLIRKMLQDVGSWNGDMLAFLENVEFRTQDDGEMGSFSIYNKRERVGVKDMAEAQFTDDDGKDVVIALITDENGYPTDLDFWKVDTSPLGSFPTPEKIFSTPK